MAVGWHEHGYGFSLGLPNAGLLDRLRSLIEKARVEHSQYNFRGLHHCSLCAQPSDLSPLENSHINLFIPGHEVIYVATAATVHYVECHGYSPPTAFIEAVNDCPEYGSAAYYDALCNANHGQRIPLQSKEEELQERRDFMEKLAFKRAQPGQ